MKLSLRKIAMVSAVALGVALSSGYAHAQGTAPVGTTITTFSNFTVADGADADYGSFFINIAGGDTPTITMDNTGTMVIAGVVDPLTRVIALTGLAGTPATVTADMPLGVDGVVVQMQRGAITDFPDANVALGSINYSTATEGALNALAATTDQPVTIVTGGTPEVVTMGSQVTLGGAAANPADGVAHNATYTLTFSY